MHAILLILGRGVGQVMFQENALSGWLMLVAIACNSWEMALLALLGTAISSLTAMLCGFDKHAVLRGLYGFNGCLVGIAVGVFFQLTALSIVLLFAAAILSTLVARLFYPQHSIPGYTAPFVLVTWLLLVLCQRLLATDLLPAVTQPMATAPDIAAAFWQGIGQVMFQPSLVSGLIFFVAILLNSRINAIYALLGAGLPLSMLLLNGADYTGFNAGLFAYNAVLCAIAIGDKTRAGLYWALAAIAVSVLLQWLGMRAGIITLTAPFVAATWITLLLRQLVDRDGHQKGDANPMALSQ